jgi:hypothetical protein
MRRHLPNTNLTFAALVLCLVIGFLYSVFPVDVEIDTFTIATPRLMAWVPTK